VTATTTVTISGLLLAEIIIIEHLLSAVIGMTLWKNKGGDPNRAFVVGAIFGILGGLALAVAKHRLRELGRAA
jgi:hypothetical protein